MTSESVKESHVIDDHMEVPNYNWWDEQQHLAIMVTHWRRAKMAAIM